MPPLAVHTFVAKQAADCLQLSLLDEQRGNLYLGSTAPDIRVLTRWERERTHFFDLSNFDEQSGISGFFDSYPALAEASRLNAPTASFVAGYLTHLVTDEMWISRIYRPFFGERSTLGGNLKANIMDRALQFSLDAERRNDSELMLHVLEAVARSELELEIEFIDRDTLREWQRVILTFVGQQPDWERFRERARRHIGSSTGVPDSDFDELAASLPDLIDETLRYLTPDRVSDCLQESLQASVRAVKDYVACG